MNISITSKLHILFVHVPQFIEMTASSLGFYSEQASESVHYAFNCHVDNYKLSKNKKKNEKLLRAVCTLNSLRI